MTTTRVLSRPWRLLLRIQRLYGPATLRSDLHQRSWGINAISRYAKRYKFNGQFNIDYISTIEATKVCRDTPKATHSRLHGPQPGCQSQSLTSTSRQASTSTPPATSVTHSTLSIPPHLPKTRPRRPSTCHTAQPTPSGHSTSAQTYPSVTRTAPCQ